MKPYLESILIVLVAMIISAFLIAGMWLGVKLVIEGWEIIKELKEICLSC